MTRCAAERPVKYNLCRSLDWPDIVKRITAERGEARTFSVASEPKCDDMCDENLNAADGRFDFIREHRVSHSKP